MFRIARRRFITHGARAVAIFLKNSAIVISGVAISRRLTSLAVITVLAFALIPIASEVDLADSEPPRVAHATLTVASTAPLQAVPRSFLGISTEYWALPLYARRMDLFERVLAMLHVRGSGPMVLRVGGDSADHAFWNPRPARLRARPPGPLPAWAFTLAPQWLHLVGGLVHRLSLHLILDLNLITDSPATAAVWARAAEAGLPRHSIVGFEIGNEPDIYSHTGWLATTAGRMIGGRRLPPALTAGDYVSDFRAYAAALRKVAPRAPLLGPALANPHTNVRWISSLLAARPPGLATVSVHRYPYSACARRRWAAFPTVARVLSPEASVGVAHSLTPAITVAHRGGLPIRLTELNSVTCGGRPGVSDAFATALWAPAAVLDLARAGIDGVNFHIRANTVNAPFALGPAGLTARPLLYGLILLARTLGPRAALAAVALHAPSSPHLSGWAVRVGRHGLHVLLINEGRHAVRIALRLPTAGAASVQRLLAPTAASRSQVTLDGQQLGHDGIWHSRHVERLVVATRSGYSLTVPRFSAALLGARLAPGALAGPPSTP